MGDGTLRTGFSTGIYWARCNKVTHFAFEKTFITKLAQFTNNTAASSDMTPFDVNFCLSF